MGFDPDIFPQIRHHIQYTDNTIYLEADGQNSNSSGREKNYQEGKKLSKISEIDSDEENGSI